MKHKIGIISDTHSLLRPEVTEKLQGCERILHAGDVSTPRILEELEKIAPVTVVRGNNDKEWAEHLPEYVTFSLYGVRISMIHIRKFLPEDLAAVDIVISGHTHKYASAWKDGVLFLNPGSCGPRLPHQEITMCLLTIEEDGSWDAEEIILPHSKPAAVEKGIPTDLGERLPAIMRDISAGYSVSQIARRYRISQQLAEAICRMYLTHPGVDVDGIMKRLGL